MYFYNKIFDPQKLHDLIRRAKAWKNKEYKDTGEPEPSSYLIALLVIQAHYHVTKHNEYGSGKGQVKTIINRYLFNFFGGLNQVKYYT